MSILVKNAKISTMDESNPKATAAVIQGKYFAYVGDEAGAMSYIEQHPDGETETVDCNGQLLIPSFNDSHMHYLHYVKTKIHVDLVGVTSLKELLQRMKDGLKDYDPASGLWYVGEGWNHDFFTDEKRFPTKEDLDTISTEYPIMIQRTCGHVGSLNSKALELFDMESGDGALYKQYAEVGPDGKLNGVIKENLFDYFKTTLPAPSVEKLVDLMIEHQKDLFAYGLTSVQSDEGNYTPQGTMCKLQELMRQKAEEGKFKLRLASQFLYFKPEVLKENFAHGYDNTFGNDTVKISATKLLSDGSLGARTAYMRNPYADDASTKGLPLYTQEALDEMVMVSHRNNVPVAIHAIGDGAIEQCLNAIEKARKAYPHLSPRHAIVHCQVTDKAMIARFKELDVIAMIQPVFIDYDMHIIYDRVGKEMAESSYAWKDYLDLGIHAPFGTDCPVESFNPMEGIYCAVTRLAKNGDGPYLPEQAYTMDEAIYAYTAEGAYASMDENIKGKVKAGMLADFTVLDKNLYEIEPKDILKTKASKTYIAGECVYEA